MAELKKIDGFVAIPWPQLKDSLLSLPKIENPVYINPAEKVMGHDDFIESHIKVIDAAPAKIPGMSTKDARRRKSIVPYYERILKYYYLRIQLIEA